MIFSFVVRWGLDQTAHVYYIRTCICMHLPRIDGRRLSRWSYSATLSADLLQNQPRHADAFMHACMHGFLWSPMKRPFSLEQNEIWQVVRSIDPADTCIFRASSSSCHVRPCKSDKIIGFVTPNRTQINLGQASQACRAIRFSDSERIHTLSAVTIMDSARVFVNSLATQLAIAHVRTYVHYVQPRENACLVN